MIIDVHRSQKSEGKLCQIWKKCAIELANSDKVRTKPLKLFCQSNWCNDPKEQRGLDEDLLICAVTQEGWRGETKARARAKTLVYRTDITPLPGQSQAFFWKGEWRNERDVS